MPQLRLSILPQTYAVCQLDPAGHIPYWALLGEQFVSLTKTADELSIVCLEKNVPAEIKAERGWRCIKAEGPFPFSAAGINVSLAVPLAQANISALAIATYETDYVLIKEQDRERTVQVLIQAGHIFR
ncbi:MAG: ACT domain-containing protein [Ktedonobacteraceae bacterium]|nr:ACT domain-containing protein [Ktedonobacteraceae bacterium]